MVDEIHDDPREVETSVTPLLARRLRAVREDRQLSQDELATMVRGDVGAVKASDGEFYGYPVIGLRP